MDDAVITFDLPDVVIAPEPVAVSAPHPELRLAEVVFQRIFADPNVRPLQPVHVPYGLDAAARGVMAALCGRLKIPQVSLPGLPDPIDAASVLDKIGHASGMVSDKRLDLVSIDPRGPGAALLERIEQGAFQPGVLHCLSADNAGWATHQDALARQGYTAVATFGANVFLVHPSIFRVDERPHVSTFDVFDTLIARRCIEPWRVFEQVGALHGLPDFTEKRQIAERMLLPGDYGLDDIYTRLAGLYGFDEATMATLKASEIACELNNVIPVAENMTRVKHGDLLISDMYLSEVGIRDLLAAAGLTKNVGLSVATHGKSKGLVWPQVAENFIVDRHLGDNPHADVAMPQRFGFTCELTSASAPNPVEQALLQAGLTDLARLCREARLTSWHADPKLRLRQIIQTSLNFPLLLLSSIVLSRLTERMERPPLLFCSRDCNLWLPLFAQVRQRENLPFDGRYFLTSRIARLKGSDAYLAYAREMLGSSGVVVDLCGTGWSMAHLARRLGVTGLHVFLIDHCPPLALYEAKEPTPDTCLIHSLMRSPPGVNNSVLELANVADHGMHVDVRQVGGTYVPVFAPENPGYDAVATAVQHDVFMRSIGLMQHYPLRDVFDLDDASLAAVCLSLYQVLSQQAPAFAAEAPGYLEENRKIVQRLVA